MTAPRVFIGLPVYNGERFLARALDSLLAQTLGDFTLLVADNASTDGTRAIAERYGALDARVRYVRHVRNIGAPANWNFTVHEAAAAGSTYFKWSTANDECAPQLLERCIAALDAEPDAVLCQGRTCLVDEDSGAREPYARDLALPDASPSARLQRLSHALELNNGQIGVIRLAALRRTRLDRPYPSGDIVLMAELALLGRFIVLPEVLLDRRMGRTTFTRACGAAHLRDFYAGNGRRSAVRDRLRLHADLISTVLRAPIAWTERRRALAIALQRLRWDRRNIWADLRGQGSQSHSQA